MNAVTFQSPEIKNHSPRELPPPAPHHGEKKRKRESIYPDVLEEMKRSLSPPPPQMIDRPYPSSPFVAPFDEIPFNPSQANPDEIIWNEDFETKSDEDEIELII